MRQRSPFHRQRPHARLRAQDDDRVEVLLYDEIGFFGIEARTFVPELQAIEAAAIDLRINSPGGDVFDGIAIFNALRAHPAAVTTHIDGLAASIASLIALAGDEVHAAPNAFFMIHNAWGITIGDAHDHRATAGTLDKVDGVIVDTYTQKAVATPGQVESWMAAETWFTAAEAEEAGFVDAVTGTESPQDRLQHFDLSLYTHPPAALAATARRPTVRDIERALRDEGFSRSEAKRMASAGFHALSQRDADDDVAGALRQLITTLAP